MPDKPETDVKIYIPRGSANSGSTSQTPQSSAEQSEQTP